MGAVARVAVNRQVLQWARERSGRTPEDLAGSFPKLAEWERGETLPTLRQLEDYARRTYTPFGYFFLETPPEDRLPIPSFRTVTAAGPVHPSPDLLATVFDMLRRQDWMREYRIAQGQERLAFVGAARAASPVQELAGAIRHQLDLDLSWASRLPSWQAAFAHLRASAERQGVLVMISGIVGANTHRALDPEEFRGFVLTDDYAPLVFINGADAKAAQIFTLAHELVHLWFNLSAAFDLRGLQPAPDETEIVCNAVAAEILLPEEELQAVWPRMRDVQQPFEALARHFKVSRIVAARRLLDLKYISREDFFAFYEEYLNEDRRRRGAHGGGDFYVTLDYKLGRPFANAVIGAAREGTLLYRDAYELIGARGETFEKFAARLGWGDPL